MLDNIKHSIVLLQIAKNTAHPINGIYHGPTVSGGGDSGQMDPIEPTGKLEPRLLPKPIGE